MSGGNLRFPKRKCKRGGGGGAAPLSAQSRSSFFFFLSFFFLFFFLSPLRLLFLSMQGAAPPRQTQHSRAEGRRANHAMLDITYRRPPPARLLLAVCVCVRRAKAKKSKNKQQKKIPIHWTLDRIPTAAYKLYICTCVPRSAQCTGIHWQRHSPGWEGVSRANQ